MRAIEFGVPLFTFVDAGVLNDHLTYEKNKHKPILKDLEFPHIDKQETAVYIFEFINYLRLRAENNSIIGFSKLEDIESHLKKQWSALFQRLLYEQRTKENEARRIDYIANQIADIKTAIITSISSAELKETAKGAIKYRMLIDFLYGLGVQTASSSIYDLLKSNLDWVTLLYELDITDIRASSIGEAPFHVILIRTDGTYIKGNSTMTGISKLAARWDEFRQCSPEVRSALISAILDNSDPRATARFIHINEPYNKQDDRQPSDEDIPF